MSDANVAFLPWARQGAAASIAIADTQAATQSALVSIDARLTINASPPISVPVRLLGPADVIGIDAQQIVRMEPPPRTQDFESNHLAAIEFDRPDFPWLFTPARANAQFCLRPWLCLIVVRRQPGVRLRSPTAEEPLRVLEIAAPAVPADELPDLAESWCWAHTQVTAEANEDLANAIAGPPERSLSRLLSPRLLANATDYLACVVPTFAVGREAGLGRAVKETDLNLAPAWTLTPPPLVVTLPVYHHWEFRTGAGGDFKTLVELLRARPAPDGLGRRAVDVTFPAVATLEVEGALQAMQPAPPPEWPPDGARGLADIVNAPARTEATGDRLLAPPIYGRWYAERSTVDPATQEPRPWLDELNLDPRHRAVAAFGTQVIQQQQETLMAAAWEQGGDLQRANQSLRQVQLGLFTSTSLHERHFRRMNDDALLFATAPAFGRVRTGGAETVAGQFLGRAIPIQAMSAPMRRISRSRGPIQRRVAMQRGAPAAPRSFLTKLNATAAAATPPPPTLITFEVVRKTPTGVRGRTYESITATLIANRRSPANFEVVSEGQPVPSPFIIDPFFPREDDAPAQAFRAAAVKHLNRLRPERVFFLPGEPAPILMGQLIRALLLELHPSRTVTAFVRAAMPASENTTRRAAGDGVVPVETLMYIPKFDRPMYEPLRDLSQEMLLPGLETVLPNSVIGLQTNRRFVDAYMVGLNTEMCSELLWRGYPTDQRGTAFEYFWDTRGAIRRRPDVLPIHLWRDRRLGDTGGSPSREQFVLLVRGDLLRRYPTAVIYATRAVVQGNKRRPDIEPGHEKLPAFRGSMQPDVFFFGFDLTLAEATGSDGKPGYFLVIQEQPTEPQFGFDSGTDFGDATHVPAAPAAHAAQKAGLLRRKPVRIAIHPSQFLRTESPADV